MQIRPVTPDDIPEILTIYAPFVKDTTVSFEDSVPTPAEFAERARHYTAQYPWLVYEHEGKIAGYAYASLFRARAAYQWDVELSVYIRPGFHAQGAGRALYTALFSLLRMQGCCNAYAVITIPNDKSVAFHRAMGFREAGAWHNTGYKLGKWRDVLFMEKQLIQTYPAEPPAFIPYPSLSPQSVAKILCAGQP